MFQGGISGAITEKNFNTTQQTFKFDKFIPIIGDYKEQNESQGDDGEVIATSSYQASKKAQSHLRSKKSSVNKKQFGSHGIINKNLKPISINTDTNKVLDRHNKVNSTKFEGAANKYVSEVNEVINSAKNVNSNKI